MSDLHFIKTKANLKCPHGGVPVRIKNQHTAEVHFTVLAHARPLRSGIVTIDQPAGLVRENII